MQMGFNRWWTKCWQMTLVQKDVLVFDNFHFGIGNIEPCRYLAIGNNKYLAHPASILFQTAQRITQFIIVTKAIRTRNGIVFLGFFVLFCRCCCCIQKGCTAFASQYRWCCCSAIALCSCGCWCGRCGWLCNFGFWWWFGVINLIPMFPNCWNLLKFKKIVYSAYVVDLNHLPMCKQYLLVHNKAAFDIPCAQYYPNIVWQENHTWYHYTMLSCSQWLYIL